MKRLVRIVAPVIAAVALTAALSASAFAATARSHYPGYPNGGGVSITDPVPAAQS